VNQSGVEDNRLKNARTLLLAVALISLAAALPALHRRHTVETANNLVSIAVDWDEVRMLAAALPGQDTDSVLRSLKQAGVTAVAVTEPVLEDFLRTGRASARRMAAGGQQGYELSSPEPDVERAIARALRTNGLTDPSITIESKPRLSTRTDPILLARLPLGFEILRGDIQRLQSRHGLEVIARAYNFPSYTREGMEAVAAEARELGMKTVIFAADEVLGWRGAVEECAETLQKAGLTFGSIEFGKQKGSERLETAWAAGSSAFTASRPRRWRSISPRLPWSGSSARRARGASVCCMSACLS